MRFKLSLLLTAACGIGLLLAAESSTTAPAKSPTVSKAAPAPKATTAAPSQAAFDKAVRPLFDSTCSMCHSAGLASGNLKVEQIGTVASLSSDRDEWDKIVHRATGGRDAAVRTSAHR